MLVLNNSQFVLLHHADAVMELFCLCCMKHIETLLAHELIVDVRMLLIQVVGEGACKLK